METFLSGRASKVAISVSLILFLISVIAFVAFFVLSMHEEAQCEPGSYESIASDRLWLAAVFFISGVAGTVSGIVGLLAYAVARFNRNVTPGR